MRSTTRAEAIGNRRFGTTDLAIVMGLWSAMAVLLGGVLSELASDTETPMARAQSEAYALQLAESEMPQMKDDMQSGRAPASVAPVASLRSGTLGKDPWGRAYQYKVVAEGVIVYSNGKNNESDSAKALERLDSGQSIREFHFAGDDVGFVKIGHKVR